MGVFEGVFEHPAKEAHIVFEVMHIVSDPVFVPEPETWAMLLAGLGIVGVVARRRQVRADGRRRRP